MESVTGDGDRNALSVNDAPPQPPTLASSSRFYLSFTDLFCLYAFALVYLFELAMVRWEFKKAKQSPFETHARLMIISFVSLFVAALATGVLFYAQKYLQSSLRDTHCNILGVICYTFGFLPSLCLLLVLGLPQNRIWIGYLVICVFIMIVVTCYFTLCMSFSVGQNDVSSLQPYQVIQDENCPVNISYILLPLCLLC